MYNADITAPCLSIQMNASSQGSVTMWPDQKTRA